MQSDTKQILGKFIKICSGITSVQFHLQRNLYLKWKPVTYNNTIQNKTNCKFTYLKKTFVTKIYLQSESFMHNFKFIFLY